MKSPKDAISKRLSLRYNPLSADVLQDVNLVIPHGKVTEIVGMSGSGKTTLVKLLLGFYPPTTSDIKVDDISLSNSDVCGHLVPRAAASPCTR